MWGAYLPMRSLRTAGGTAHLVWGQGVECAARGKRETQTRKREREREREERDRNSKEREREREKREIETRKRERGGAGMRDWSPLLSHGRWL